MSDGREQAAEEASTRKRVTKACDRCRNKKSKCDGGVPCKRCVEDNICCLYGERDKTQDKVWPRGTVELQQKAIAIYENAIIELYEKLRNERQWIAPLVQRGGDGRPSLHEIIVRVASAKEGDLKNLQDVQSKLDKRLSESSTLSTYDFPQEINTGVKTEPRWSPTMPMSVEGSPGPPTRKEEDDEEVVFTPPEDLVDQPHRSPEPQVPEPSFHPHLATPDPSVSPGALNTQGAAFFGGYFPQGYPANLITSQYPFGVPTAPPSAGLPDFGFGGFPYAQGPDNYEHYGWGNPNNQLDGEDYLNFSRTTGNHPMYSPYAVGSAHTPQPTQQPAQQPNQQSIQQRTQQSSQQYNQQRDQQPSQQYNQQLYKQPSQQR